MPALAFEPPERVVELASEIGGRRRGGLRGGAFGGRSRYGARPRGLCRGGIRRGGRPPGGPHVRQQEKYGRVLLLVKATEGRREGARLGVPHDRSAERFLQVAGHHLFQIRYRKELLPV